MMQIDSKSIYLLILFILPGFFAFSVSKSLYRQAKETREIEVTYRSLLYSLGIYAILYIAFQFTDTTMTMFAEEHPFVSIIIVLVLSLIWGIATYAIISNDILYTLLSKTKLLKGKTLPPNLYAVLFDKEYQPKAKNGCWVIYNKNGVTREGWVKYTDVERGEYLIFVTEIKEFDEEGNLLRDLPKNLGIF